MLAAAGCQFPDDVEGTLDRVQAGHCGSGSSTTRRGSTSPSRACRGRTRPGPRVCRADRRRDRVDPGSESELAGAMRGFQLDLIIGGLDRQWPYGRELAMTRPYVDTEVEIGVPPGTELPTRSAGSGSGGAKQRGSRAAQAGGRGCDPGRLRRALQVTARPFWTPRDRRDRLQRTDYILRDDEHAIATPRARTPFSSSWRTSCSTAAKRRRTCCTPRPNASWHLRRAVRYRDPGELPRTSAGAPPGGADRADQHRLLDQPDRPPLLRPRLVAGDEGSLGGGHPRVFPPVAFLSQRATARAPRTASFRSATTARSRSPTSSPPSPSSASGPSSSSTRSRS